MFGYACREDSYGLPRNPVTATTKRREMPAAVLDFYEPEEVEALARAAAAGLHRPPPTRRLSADELEWRAWEDRQDGELYRMAAYTGMRMGELLTLRWEDVGLGQRRVIVHRAVSAGVEGPTKSWQARALPLADPAAMALARLAERGDYTERNDYVFCSRLGRSLDGSSLRQRFYRARDAAGLRALRFHSLRHAAGSLVAREAGAHFVQAFLGHSRLSTHRAETFHAKARPQDVDVRQSGLRGSGRRGDRAGRLTLRDASLAPAYTRRARSIAAVMAVATVLMRSSERRRVRRGRCPSLECSESSTRREWTDSRLLPHPGVLASVAYTSRYPGWSGPISGSVANTRYPRRAARRSFACSRRACSSSSS